MSGRAEYLPSGYWLARAARLAKVAKHYEAASREIREIAQSLSEIRRGKRPQRPPSLFKRSVSRRVNLFPSTDARLADLADMRMVRPGTIAGSILETVIQLWGGRYPYDEDLYLRRCADPKKAETVIDHSGSSVRPDFSAFGFTSAFDLQLLGRAVVALLETGLSRDQLVNELCAIERAWKSVRKRRS